VLHDLLVVADVEIIPRYERPTETSGISELRLSTLIDNIRVETKEMRVEYPDEIKRQYWEDLIKTVFTDFFEPIRENLRKDSVNLVRKFKEVFDIEHLMKPFDEANDEDGAFLEDVELIPYEGSMLIGINLKMKNIGQFDRRLAASNLLIND
jgi:hypothetical protein